MSGFLTAVRRVLFWLVLLTLIFVGVRLVFSQTDCDSIVVDQANVIAATSLVPKAVSEFESLTGADLRIRTIPTFRPHGTLDQYKDSELQRCRSWQSTDGGMKNNLIVIMVAIQDRKTGLYYGDQWRSALDQQWPNINSKMGPRFRDGDFGGGIALGLRETLRAIQVATAPQPAPQPVIVQTEPIDLTWLVWFVIIAGVLTGGIFLTRGISAVHRLRTRKRAAQQAARLNRGNVQALVLKLDEPFKINQARLSALKIPEKRGFADRLGTIRSRYNGLVGQAQHLTESLDPNDSRLSREEYEQMSTSYTDVLSGLREIDIEMEKLNIDLTTLQERVHTLPNTLSSLRANIATAEKQIETGRQQFDEIAATYAKSSWTSISGNGTEAEKRLSRAQSALKDLPSSDVWKDLEVVDDITKWLAEVDSFMRSIATLRDNLETAKREATKEIKEAQTDIATAQRFIEQHQDDIGKGFTADLTAAADVLGKARAELTEDKPDFLKIVSWANEAERIADLVLSKAQNEHENAERQRRLATSSLRNARIALDTLREYIEDHQHDVTSSATAAAARAEEEYVLAKGHTRPESITSRATRAYETAQQALQEAKEDFQRAERRRNPPVVIRSHDSYSYSSRHDSSNSSSSFGSWGSGGGSSGFGGSSSGGGGSSSW